MKNKANKKERNHVSDPGGHVKMDPYHSYRQDRNSRNLPFANLKGLRTPIKIPERSMTSSPTPPTKRKGAKQHNPVYVYVILTDN